MAVREIVELYYDITNEVLRDSSGNVLRVFEYPAIAYKQKQIINLNIVTDADLTAYTGLDATAQFQVALDKNFRSDNLMCKTLDAGFNKSGEWDSSSEQADVTNGEISFGLNASTTGFLAKIGTDAELPGTELELQVLNAEGTIVHVWRFPYRALGIVNDNGDVPELESDNFQWFTTESGAQGLRIVNDAGEVLEVLTPAGE